MSVEKLSIEDLDIKELKEIKENINTNNIDEEEEINSLPNSSEYTKNDKWWYERPEYNDGKHYTTQKALSQPFEYALINGGRSNGKTTGWQFQMVDDHFKTGAVYGKIVRKFEFDRRKIIQWFDKLVIKYLKEVYHHDLIVDGFNYYVVPDETCSDRYYVEDGRRKRELNKQLLCQTFNLNQEVNDKSHDYTYIKTLIFEEYTLINQYEYLSNEVEHFQSLISTINRERTDLKVVFIGNTISKHNPYFEWLGININQLKLQQGDSKRLQNSNYKNGARFYVEFVPTVYKDIDVDCPRILKVNNNEIAITGDWVISEYIYESEFDDFISSLNPKFNFAIKTNNKIYYHCTCSYKNTIFNVISSRMEGIKAGGLTFEYDLSAIQRIKNGSMQKSKLFQLLGSLEQCDTLYSDDEIEYKFTKLLRGL